MLSKSSKNTTTYTTELTLAELREIIELSKEAGVYKLSFKGAHIEFLAGQPGSYFAHAYNSPQQGQASPDEIAKQNEAAKHLQITEQELEELLITDPAAYEELLANRELEDGREEQEV